MKNLLQIIESQYPDFKAIEVNPILTKTEQIVGYDATAYLNDDFPVGGGTHQDESVAIRICVAESLERAFFRKISASPLAGEFLIAEFPSTCGFALGFENEKTKLRALAEALERWAWSKWIDEGYYIPEKIKIDVTSDPLASEHLSRFSKFRCFQKQFSFSGFDFNLGIFLGFADGGIFAGSRVCSPLENPWPHAIIEAYRNLSNYRNAKDPQKGISRMTIVRERVIYFGDHPAEALAIIEATIKNKDSLFKANWPEPKLRLLKNYNTEVESVYLWRALCEDWLGWDKGSEKRFVY